MYRYDDTSTQKPLNNGLSWSPKYCSSFGSVLSGSYLRGFYLGVVEIPFPKNSSLLRGICYEGVFFRDGITVVSMLKSVVSKGDSRGSNPCHCQSPNKYVNYTYLSI